MALKFAIVNYPHEADYKVCLCDYDKDQKGHQMMVGGKLVKYPYEADVKVCIVKYPNQADIVITRKNFPQ